MKQTDFRFELRVSSDNPHATLGRLESKLRILKGINSVSFGAVNHAIKLSLNASFEDGEQAEKLHRKVMNSIMAHDGVTISEVTTTLTDIF